MVLGSLLERLNLDYGGYELLAHHTQGEFHHDVVLRVQSMQGVPGMHGEGALPGEILVVSTNCNGGIKEVLVFEAEPDLGAALFRPLRVDERARAQRAAPRVPAPPARGWLGACVEWAGPRGWRAASPTAREPRVLACAP